MAKKHLRFHQDTRFHHSLTMTCAYDTKYEVCSGCQVDVKNMLNAVRQAVNHEDLSLCPFLGPKNIYDKAIREAGMQHKAKHPHNTVKKELVISCYTARRPQIVKPNSNLKVKTSNIIDQVYSTSPDPTYTIYIDQQYEADDYQSFLSFYKHISNNEHQSYDEKIPDPNMKGAAIPSQLYEQMSHSFINSFQDFNQFTF
eukprot:8697803-Ditylum_brightwellii.AAC.1